MVLIRLETETHPFKDLPGLVPAVLRSTRYHEGKELTDRYGKTPPFAPRY